MSRISRRAPAEKVEEYAQEVWMRLSKGGWMRLLQWRTLYDDGAWHEHGLEGFLKRITDNKVRDLLVVEPAVLPQALDLND